jgi:putative hydrolase of the HAD superfamily
VVIRAVLFDFGGVISTSPFDSFANFERVNGLPEGIIRTINSTNPDTNAWSQLERSAVDLEGFCSLFEAEAHALGHELDGHAVLACLAGEIRPEMVQAIRRCSQHFQTGCLTNNFVPTDLIERPQMAEVYALFDAVIESSKVGVRKPDPRIYEIACDALEVVPEQVVFLDDLGVNLKPARAMGMATIKVVTPAQALRELSELLGIDLGE